MTFKRLNGERRTLRGRARDGSDIPGDEHAPERARSFVDDVLVGDPDELRLRVRHVVTELVTNSVKHANKGHVHIELERTEDGSVDVDVRDGGPGFDVVPRAPGHDDQTGWGLVFVDMLSESWAAGGPGAPIVWAHFEPRTLDDDVDDDDDAAPADPLLDARVRDLLDVRMLLESVKDYAIFGLDRHGRVTIWNSGAERLTGYSTDEVLGLGLAALHEDLVLDEELGRALSQGRHSMERWMRRKDGSQFWADSVLTPILDHSATLRGFSVVARDATWRKRLDDDRQELITRIRLLARTDDLTGLTNRRGWQEELDREMARARRSRSHLCVAMVDLDDFKGFNDQHGHISGDELLRATASAWAQALRATDLIARYGGDEFSVILPDCLVEEAGAVVERLRCATPRPATCSVGLACSDASEPTETFIRRADAALFAAKRAGRNATAYG